jgi:putative phosphoesterase
MSNDIDEVDARDCRRIGLVSDSHGPVDGRIVEALSDCDFLIHAGDLGGITALNTLLGAAPAIAVRGNNDNPPRWCESERDALRLFPAMVRVELSDGHIIVIHGHQFPTVKKRHRQLRERFPDAMAIVYGHSHRLVMDIDSSPWVLNPGACGRARTFGGPSGLILARKSRRWELSSIRFAPPR